jgi:hypothetical protein
MLHNATSSSPLQQQKQRAGMNMNMRVGSSHGTEAEAQMKRLRLVSIPFTRWRSQQPRVSFSLGSELFRYDCIGCLSLSHAHIRQQMPTLGWWRAGVRVPVPAQPTSPSATSNCNNAEIHPPQASSLSSSSEAAAPWLGAMDHEAAGARNYELTNYNILHESTWGGGQGAADRLRALLAPPSPPLLPAVPPSPLPLARENRVLSGVTEEKRAASKGNLRDMTSAGLFKVCATKNHGSCYSQCQKPVYVRIWPFIIGFVLFAPGVIFVLTQVLAESRASTTLALDSQR